MSSTSHAKDQSDQQDGGPPVSGSADRLQITITRDGARVFLSLAGELDIETSAELDRQLGALHESSLTHLVLDLRDVEFIDSTGLAAIVRAQRLADSNGHTLALRRGSRQVQRVLELTGLSERLLFED